MTSIVRRTIRWGVYVAIGLAVAVIILLVVGMYSAPVTSPPVIT